MCILVGVCVYSLWDCNLTPACSEALAAMLSTSKLRDLNLGANSFNDEGLIRLVGALGTSTCALQKLGFSLYLSLLTCIQTHIIFIYKFLGFFTHVHCQGVCVCVCLLQLGSLSFDRIVLGCTVISFDVFSL